MSSFDIDVTRDGGCWTVHIREVNGPALADRVRRQQRRRTSVPLSEVTRIDVDGVYALGVGRRRRR